MKRIAGFTLIELMVVVGLVAVLATIAVPAYRHMIAGNRVTGAVNALAASLVQARSEAVTRGVQVTVCPSRVPSATPPRCGGDWDDGWISFVSERGSPGIYQSGDELIRVHGPIGSQVRMTSEESYIAFDRMGFAQPTFSAGSATTSLAVVACPPDERPANARAVVLSRSGSISTGAGSDFGCSS